jgi:hypothetical protein
MKESQQTGIQKAKKKEKKEERGRRKKKNIFISTRSKNERNQKARYHTKTLCRLQQGQVAH